MRPNRSIFPKFLQNCWIRCVGYKNSTLTLSYTDKEKNHCKFSLWAAAFFCYSDVTNRSLSFWLWDAQYNHCLDIFPESWKQLHVFLKFCGQEIVGTFIEEGLKVSSFLTSAYNIDSCSTSKVHIWKNFWLILQTLNFITHTLLRND